MKNSHPKNQDHLKISINNADFNCKVLGQGPKFVIAFHGFGQNNNCYSFLAKENTQYTIYSFDLPFHGGTTIHDNTAPLSSDEIYELVKALLEKTNIDTFSLLAFSIGARLTLPIIGKFGSIIDHFWLLAPDGISNNFWFGLSTGSKVMRSLFRKVLDRSSWFLWTGNLLKSMRLLDHRKSEFVFKSIETSDKRNQVYNTWVFLRELKFDEIQLVDSINQYKLDVTFVLGENDKVIPPHKLGLIAKRIKNSKVVILPCGHHNLIKNFSEWIKNEKV